jgi:hypothetical protein
MPCGLSIDCPRDGGLALVLLLLLALVLKGGFGETRLGNSANVYPRPRGRDLRAFFSQMR